MLDVDLIDFDQRFQPGKVQYISEDLIQVELLSDAFKRRLARITGADLDALHSNLKKGDEVEVFITGTNSTGFTLDSNNLFYASILWSDKKKNPWITDKPKEGYIYEGIAIQFSKHVKGVIVELNSGITGLLPFEEIPKYSGSNSNINEIIDIGDQIIVAVKQVNYDLLRVYLSLTLALDRLSVENKERRLSNYDANLIELCSTQKYFKNQPAKSPVREVGVLGFDYHFAEHLMNWLNLYGYQTIHIRDKGNLNIITRPANAPSHLVLCSSNFSMYSSEDTQLLKQIKKKGIHMQWIAEPKFAPLIDMPALPAKVLLSDILGLLEDNEDNEDYREKDYSSPDKFRFDAYQEERVGRLADFLLQRICYENQFTAALWVIRERPGSYDIRASYNISTKSKESIRYSLNQTFIASSIKSGEERIIETNRAGELGRLVTEDRRYIWILPIPFSSFDEEPKVRRAVAFFSPEYRYIDNSKRYSIREKYLGVMQAYVETLYFARHNESLTAFARIGVNSVSLMHEIARQTGTVRDQVEDIINKKDTDLDELNRLYKNVKELDSLSHGSMRDIMKTSHKYASIREIVISLAEDFKHRSTLQNTDFDVCLPDHPLRISLPRLAISHALRNVLDNAFYFVQPLGDQGYIHVEVVVDDDRNNETPLWIDVVDNGLGVRASMESRLFKPRHSAKNVEGIGMGLHISQGLIRNIGGEIRLVRSIRWKETRFRIELPIILDRGDNSNYG